MRAIGPIPWAPRAPWRLLLLGALLATASCADPSSAPSPEPSRLGAAQGQVAAAPDKVLILASSVSGGAQSREAQAAASLGATIVDIVTPAQWAAMTREDFMGYGALIVGDAACQGDTAALQAAVQNRDVWGPVVDGDIVLVGADPTANHTPQLVENGIAVALDYPGRTGMYVALGCAYQSAPPDTPVPLLEPFGSFQVAGVGCSESAHMFQTTPSFLSSQIQGADASLAGDGCAARSVFTHYPDRNFTPAALATGALGPVPPQPYDDYPLDAWGEPPTTYYGAPYVLVRGAAAVSAGCSNPDVVPPGEECDLGDFLNGQPATLGQDPESTCSYACKLHWCGDGNVDAQYGEECDDGVANGRSQGGSYVITEGMCTKACKIVQASAPPSSPPDAVCKNVVITAVGTGAVAADIDDGSSDPDGDLAGCTQDPPGPYPIGTTAVTLTCTDQQGHQDTCQATVQVLEDEAPTNDCLEVHLNDYNLFLLEDYSGGHDVQGKVAAGGDVTLTDFAVGSGLAAGDIARTLVAGSDLTLSRGAVWGDAFYGATYSAPPSVSYPRGVATQGTPIDFAARFAALRGLSSQLAGLPANGTTIRTPWGGVMLSGSNPDRNVFQVPAGHFTGATLLSIDAPAGSLVVVNIVGASATFTNFGHSFSGGIDQHGVLYNFVDATAIHASGYGFWGTVLAPYAHVDFSNGSWDGGLYAVSLTGNAEGHINALTDRTVCP